MIRGWLLAAAVVAASAGVGIWLHGQDFEETGVVEAASPGASGGAGFLGEAKVWSFEHVVADTGAVEWRAAGASAAPESETVWNVERPDFTLFDLAGDPPHPTRIRALHGRASFPKAADTVVRLADDVVVTRGAYTIRTEELALTLPQGARSKGRSSRLATDRA
ncbi:MAG TPA: hypothetical protein VHF22_12595, partial [Planctomycetota bacterium]|nr:hypothetical protein [Planctomycetota bacterium]